MGRKCYGSIPHLPNSRLGSGDHSINDGQAAIATVKTRDKHDVVVVQEKLDGSNVGVAMIDGEIVPLVRAGYLASSSPYEMHHQFDSWVSANKNRFKSILNDGERVCGEWLTHAHGTKYKLPHEPFVAFDIIDSNNRRMTFDEITDRVKSRFVMPSVVHCGGALSVENAMSRLGKFGQHGALEPIEGAVWRIERDNNIQFLCKFVAHDKQDGKYLKGEPILNEWES